MALHAPNQRKEQGRWWYDAKVRALIFQCLAVAAVIAFLFYIINNALTNLATRGITTGFDFLGNTAGFGILQSLIPYDETYTFGRTFVVGLLNTLLVSVLGILFATLLGFVLGVARLSSNWLVAKIATVYIETFRNIPLLLQIFFWYFSVLRTLPSPRQSVELGELAFLNVRGLYIPKPLFEDGFGYVLWALLLALLVSWGLRRWAHRRQELTGRSFPVWLCSIGLLILLPLLTFLLVGSPLSWSIPTLQGFNFRGGLTVLPELAALLLALTIYTAAFIAEIVRSGIQAISKGQTEAASALGLSPTKTLRLVVIPQAMRVIIPPLTSQYLNLTKKLFAGHRHRLSGSGLGVHGDHPQPDRAGDRGDRHDHGGLSAHQYHHLGADEHLQPQDDAGGALGRQYVCE
ncbi:ABC transporter permease subunit [Aeromonas encheleia]|uniref:amino acid ABC transporter permease n=1 Tax=Aeromonas encheleia TaxID=73010 RepID=UPI001F560920|nr:ABC transporter permease subunit [Aeromonas encheleia]UNP89414.1 ABC transporter permease subunit [Aeromonas encheleia]